MTLFACDSVCSGSYLSTFEEPGVSTIWVDNWGLVKIIFPEMSLLYQNIRRHISQDVIFKCLNITAVSLGRFITCYIQNISTIFHFNDIYCQKKKEEELISMHKM